MQTSCYSLASVVVLSLSGFAGAQTSAPASAPAERTRTVHFNTGVRAHLNWAAGDANTGRPANLIFYLLPNGNTIEQTAGCVCPDADWHYRIQHIAAQVRRLREAIPEETFVVAYLQADAKSWPAWKSKNANYRELIPRIVAAVIDESGLERPSMSLVAHSGGGAFITGFIDSFPEIPDRLDRIAFLDANYSYSDDNKHGDKLLRWLGKSGRHVLSVICYDDREITLNGKKVLGPTGGTWRATHRMFDRFRKDVELKETVTEPIVHVQGLEGRIDVLMHKNPDNKILHTVLVGEMGGLVHAITVAGPRAGKAGHVRRRLRIRALDSARAARHHDATVDDAGTVSPRGMPCRRAPGWDTLSNRTEIRPFSARGTLLAAARTSPRVDGRRPDQLRPVEMIRHYTKFSPGSVLMRAGDTVVLCTASVEESVPEWMVGKGRGWVTAEYDMLPGSTGQRRQRNRKGVDGRATEIQRLIGRVLRSVVDFTALGERTIWLDCDVLQADGGTRTAAITGAYVALCDAVTFLQREKA